MDLRGNITQGDGIYKSTDAGKTWQHMGLEDSQTNARIRVNPTNPDVVYAAVFGHPAAPNEMRGVYKSSDGNKTWTEITSGIAADDYLHVVREDTQRSGLLFAGAEHGLYVSFDNGANWTRFPLRTVSNPDRNQENAGTNPNERLEGARASQTGAPQSSAVQSNAQSTETADTSREIDTQVADLVVEDHDLVVATHGRGFYVLDNIAPLRQLTPDVRNASLHVFSPEAAVRRDRPVTIDYVLSKPAKLVNIDILDAQGKVIRSYSSIEKKPLEGAAEQEDFQRNRTPKVPATAGLNRFNWDLRYEGATVFEGLVMWGARASQGPWAVPGQYQVRVTADGQTETRPFELKMDPRVNVSIADLQKQFDLAMRVREKTSQADEAVITIRKVRDEINDRLKTSTAAKAKQSGATLITKLTTVEEAIYQTRNRSGQDPLNFPIKLNNKISHLMGVIEDADAPPTEQSYSAFEQLSQELDVQLSSLHETLQTDLAAFNRALSKDAQPVTVGQ